MTVYVVIHDYDWNRQRFCGVFSTVERAKDYVNATTRYKKREWKGNDEEGWYYSEPVAEGYSVEPHEVDAEEKR